jgi:cell fate regulator YaaT (PSP1 superfamily)
MSEPETIQNEAKPSSEEAPLPSNDHLSYYRLRFRTMGQEYTVDSLLHDLAYGTIIMAKTDHGAEPGVIVGRAANAQDSGIERKASSSILRRASQEEEEKFTRLVELEQEAFAICERHVGILKLPMQLVRVERFFNGSKIIFYFTAENRVDFRELVKNLVQEFRTRVEMRQIGVRHETQMLGGIGPCGRELCCSSFLNKFESVSIKMAKTQDLPLNPAKISGVCNRLLCCLTYEYDAYRTMKKGMPRIGRWINYQGNLYRVVRLIPLLGRIHVVSRDGEEMVLNEEQWQKAEPSKGPVKQEPRES